MHKNRAMQQKKYRTCASVADPETIRLDPGSWNISSLHASVSIRPRNFNWFCSEM